MKGNEGNEGNEGHARRAVEDSQKKRSANCIQNKFPHARRAGRLSGFVQSPSSSFLECVAICSFRQSGPSRVKIP
jgi:hypothetical protein